MSKMSKVLHSNKCMYLLKEWWYKTFHMGGTGSQNLHHNKGAPGKLNKEEQRSGAQELNHWEKSVTTWGRPNYAFQNCPSFGKKYMYWLFFWCRRCRKYRVWNIVELIVCILEVSKGIHVHILYTALLFQACWGSHDKRVQQTEQPPSPTWGDKWAMEKGSCRHSEVPHEVGKGGNWSPPWGSGKLSCRFADWCKHPGNSCQENHSSTSWHSAGQEN